MEGSGGVLGFIFISSFLCSLDHTSSRTPATGDCGLLVFRLYDLLSGHGWKVLEIGRVEAMENRNRAASGTTGSQPQPTTGLIRTKQAASCLAPLLSCPHLSQLQCRSEPPPCSPAPLGQEVSSGWGSETAGERRSNLPWVICLFSGAAPSLPSSYLTSWCSRLVVLLLPL